MNSRYSSLVGGVLLAAALASCATGPRYVRPQVPIPEKFGEGQGTFDATRPPASALWHSFGDQTLDRLIDTALARNNTLAQSIAKKQARRSVVTMLRRASLFGRMAVGVRFRAGE